MAVGAGREGVFMMSVSSGTVQLVRGKETCAKEAVWKPRIEG